MSRFCWNMKGRYIIRLIIKAENDWSEWASLSGNAAPIVTFSSSVYFYT